MRSIAILGANGHGKIVADVAESCGFSKIAFFDDELKGTTGPWEISGNTELLISKVRNYDAVFVAVGNNVQRERIYYQLSLAGGNLTSLIHPSATVSRYASIDQAVLALPKVVVNAFAKIGKGVILNTSATIDHECVVGDFSHVSPGANVAGGVIIGARSWIGIGSCIKQCIRIGQDAVIAAGAVVIRDVPDKLTVAGVPANIISTSIKC